jgi:hypothetical protein
VAADPAILYLVGRDLVECARARLAATPYGEPSRVSMTAGAVVEEVDGEGCCSQLTGTVARVYPSTSFPLQDGDAQPCHVPLTAVEYRLRVVRCSTQPQAPMELAPTVEALDEEARRWAVDALAVRTAVACCLQALGNQVEWLMGDTTPTGPGGGCVGSETAVTVGFGDLCNCRA